MDVFKTRLFFPAYPTTGRFHALSFLTSPVKPAEGEQAPWIIITNARPLTITVVDQEKGTSVVFHVPTRFERWRFDTGGVYAFAWARDEELVTVPVHGGDPNAPQTLVKVRRAGDSIGPATGVTFFFHPSNYPDYGFEFGTASNANRPNSYFLGVGGRLRTFGDHTLLTFATGVARVNVKSYQGITSGQTYASDDPLLTGRQRFVTVPYISLGLGVNFGANDTKNGSPAK